MDAKQLLSAREAVRTIMEQALYLFVNEKGHKPAGYEIDEFGLDEGRDGEESITKIYNLLDNGGCYFYEPSAFNDDTLNGINEENFHEKTYEGTTHTAYQCLYIVVDANGKESLKYYRFTNGGLNFDEDQAEPDHDYAAKLPLLDLDYIVTAIGKIEDAS